MRKATAAIAATCSALATAVVVAQLATTTRPPDAAPTAAGRITAPGTFVGVASCVNSGCHGSTTPLQAARILQNEYYTWLNRDPHAGAYNVLFNKLSTRITKNMRLPVPAYESAVCLDCHTTNIAASRISGRIDREDGVQCEACHGPAGGWRDEHVQVGWTHEQSVQRGMTDLRSVTERGTVCLSCHLGDKTREVDHELIASGHPVLVFEQDNYSETMPPHWRPAPDRHGVRAWATGQALKLRESLDNLARHARGEEWPEFSDMSCYNCHHSLKNSEWRQERGWPDRAGLPAWSPQHWAITRLLVGKAAPGSRASVDEAMQQVSFRVSRMNDREGIAGAAEEARQAIEAVLPKIDSLQWSDGEVRAMIAAIADDRSSVLIADVHAAEQTALSLQTLVSALTRRDSRLLRGNLVRAVDQVFAEVRDREGYNPAQFSARVKKVKEAL